MPPSDPELRIALAQRCLRVYASGLLGLIPLVGIPFGLAALILGSSVCFRRRKAWIPGRLYAWIGMCLAPPCLVYQGMLCGTLLSFL